MNSGFCAPILCLAAAGLKPTGRTLALMLTMLSIDTMEYMSLWKLVHWSAGRQVLTKF